MERITAEEIRSATGGTLSCGSKNTTVSQVVHDSRMAGPGDVFFALQGERHDGHQYLSDVLCAGCRCLVVSHMDWDRSKLPADAAVIQVSNTKTAADQIGRASCRERV